MDSLWTVRAATGSGAELSVWPFSSQSRGGLVRRLCCWQGAPPQPACLPACLSLLDPLPVHDPPVAHKHPRCQGQVARAVTPSVEGRLSRALPSALCASWLPPSAVNRPTPWALSPKPAPIARVRATALNLCAHCIPTCVRLYSNICATYVRFVLARVRALPSTYVRFVFGYLPLTCLFASALCAGLVLAIGVGLIGIACAHARGEFALGFSVQGVYCSGFGL